MKLSDKAIEVVNHFKQLNIAGNKVQTPYYINTKRARGGLIVLAGKGSPEELEEEVLIYGKLRGIEFEKKEANQIREFMMENGLGIDCSGFVVHVLDAQINELFNKRLWNLMTFKDNSFVAKVRRYFRPISNISADDLTNELSTKKIKMKDIQPCDLIRLKALKKGDHVLLITEVDRDQAGKPTKITYTQSSQNYGINNGVREGVIEITKPDKELEAQNWLEVDVNGVCWTKQQYEKELEDNGIRRLKFLDDNNE